MNKPEILVIDDESAIRKLLEITLESNGYKTSFASNGKDGIRMAANHPPDLIILDIGLPDLSGHEIIQTLRTWFHKSILILSVLNSEADIVQALDFGADDYLTKPFRNAELLARIRSAIRRNQTTLNNPLIEIGDLLIDLAARTVFKNKIPLKLTSTEFNLLALFVVNENRVLTHHYLLNEIWGPGYKNQTQYLRVFVGALRKKIENDTAKPIHIITESGVGYRFQ